MTTPFEYRFQASCPRGLEQLLAGEAQQLGFHLIRETVGGVFLEGDLATAYRFCLWSRLANRLLLILAETEVESAEQLYQAMLQVDWVQHLDVGGTLLVDFSGQSRDIRNSHFGALKCKDAVVDTFETRGLPRPSIAKDQPDIRIDVRLRKGRVSIALDLSGDSLHRRGYRIEGGLAPLKENLAAALLLRADWPAVASRGGMLLDPMCGSGTLLIEGAMMAMGIAPGIDRRYWGFLGWKQHEASLWRSLLEEAREARKAALARQWPPIIGFDANGKIVNQARQNISRAGLGKFIDIQRQELSELTRPDGAADGLVICNPPYGERLGEEAELLHLYRHFGAVLRSEFDGWNAAIFTGNPELGKRMGLRSHRQYQLHNGEIESRLLLFKVSPEAHVNDRNASQAQQAEGQQNQAPLSPGGEMFANRLRKNLKRMAKWRKREGITCFRVYDADMPEYSVAVDFYEGQIHIAEYKAPQSVAEDDARRRLRDVINACSVVFECRESDIALKERRRQKGSEQYQRRAQKAAFLEVKEGQATVLVNLHDYLDTGLFLDHRPVRLDIARMAKGQRFLNLFCYTAVATVHAGLGGARHSTSVDMSHTYLQWARKNLSLNGLSEARHRTEQADCQQWLKECREKFDLILLDPPTFSNSKRMDGVLDTQRDHVALINDAMACLDKNGLLIFSTNKRDFVLDDSLSSRFQIEDRCRWSLDEDFVRRSKAIHYCWYIRHLENAG